MSGDGYGRAGRLIAAPGRRDELADLLRRAAEAVSAAEGCRLYLVGVPDDDPDGVWVIEAWDDTTSHRASLTLAGVQALIAEGRPLIAGMGESIEMSIGGHGIT